MKAQLTTLPAYAPTPTPATRAALEKRPLTLVQGNADEIMTTADFLPFLAVIQKSRIARQSRHVKMISSIIDDVA